jgi:hypothetical protein
MSPFPCRHNLSPYSNVGVFNDPDTNLSVGSTDGRIGLYVPFGAPRRPPQNTFEPWRSDFYNLWDIDELILIKPSPVTQSASGWLGYS